VFAFWQLHYLMQLVAPHSCFCQKPSHRTSGVLAIGFRQTTPPPLPLEYMSSGVCAVCMSKTAPKLGYVRIRKFNHFAQITRHAASYMYFGLAG